MIAGLPGTGIGGIFYILLALTMPVCELLRLVRRQSSIKRWITIAAQTFNALGILAGVCLTGWLLACGLNAYRAAAPGEAGRAVAVMQRTANVIPAASAYTAIATLGGVILATHVLRILLRGRKSLPRAGREVLPLPPATGGTILPR
jgi:hypothetical protein